MKLITLLTTSVLAIVTMSCATPDTTPRAEVSQSALTVTPLATDSLTQIENWTPTISSTNVEGQKLVQELLENNGGCKLPCWWGFTPGKTTWVEARQILEGRNIYKRARSERNFLCGCSCSTALSIQFREIHGAFLSHRKWSG